MAARVRELSLATSGKFTVGEISKALVKSMNISPLSATKAESKGLNKLVSNELGELCKKGLLERVRGKKGTYRRTDLQHETVHADTHRYGTTMDNPRGDADVKRGSWREFREANRMKPPEILGEPLPIDWPLELEQEFRVYPRNIIVAGGVTNSGKTILALETVRLNIKRFQITYINSEMSEEELAERLRLFEQAYGIPWRTFYDHVYFAYCNCNALQPMDMTQLAGLIDPDGINIIDYIKIHDKFYMIGECLEKIHAKLNKGIAIVFFQKDPFTDHLLGKSFAEHLARVVMMIDIDKKTQLRRLQFTKVKAPAQKGDKPEKRQIWFSEKGGVQLERKPQPSKS